VVKELIDAGVIRPDGEVIGWAHKPPMSAEEAKKRLIERFEIPGEATIISFKTDDRLPIYRASIQWEIVTRVSLGIWDGAEHWDYDRHAYSGSYNFLDEQVTYYSVIY
jgi:hypothetical protein